MIAVPMMMRLFIGFVAFKLFLNLYIIEIVLLISSSLLLPEHIIVISVPAKRELFIQVQYAMSSIGIEPSSLPGGKGEPLPLVRPCLIHYTIGTQFIIGIFAI